jgi:hypothetical protein
MKVFWFNIIAIVIALSSVVVDRPSVEFTYKTLTTLQKIPLFQTDALKNDSRKHTEKTVHIAQDFIPVLVIADAPDYKKEFHHYLSIYSLVRQKEYFLLI